MWVTSGNLLIPSMKYALLAPILQMEKTKGQEKKILKNGGAEQRICPSCTAINSEASWAPRGWSCRAGAL